MDPESLQITEADSDQGKELWDVVIDEGMVNQISRNGILPKKLRNGDELIRMRTSDQYYREYVKMATVVMNEFDLHGEVIAHMPLMGVDHPQGRPGSIPWYLGEKDIDFCMKGDLSELHAAADRCQFCRILADGIGQMRPHWAYEFIKLRWLDAHPDIQHKNVLEQEPWWDDYLDVTAGEGDIPHDQVHLLIRFPKDCPCLHVSLWVSPPGSDPPFEYPHQLARRRKIAELEFYTLPDQPSEWAAFGAAPHINESLEDIGALNQFWQWICQCQGNHPECKSRYGKELPARLLEIAVAEDDSSLTCRLLDVDCTKWHEYVALSHCWTYTKPLRTTSANLEAHKQDIPWDELSQAIQETMTTISRMGLKYVWIDALCIVQDDKLEWEQEAPRMHMIYGNSLVTFVAHGPSLGLEREPACQCTRFTEPDKNTVYCRTRMNHRSFFTPAHDTNSWYGRAWCMQERFFGARTLHFGSSFEEVYFECNNHVTCECGQISREFLARDKTLKARLIGDLDRLRSRDIVEDTTDAKNALWRTYISICEDYAARGITYATDTLPAISSLANVLSPTFGGYHAGLWDYKLILSLQWEALSTLESSRHKDYVAPSFCWASRSGAVIWYMDLSSSELPNPDSYQAAEVLECSCTPQGLDPFGAVSSGHLVIAGWTVEMEILDIEPLAPDGRLPMVQNIDVYIESMKCYVTLDSKEDIEEMTVGKKAICLDIMRDKVASVHGKFVSALVLLPFEETDGVYRRIGFSTMLEKHFDERDSERKVVTIV